MKVFFTSDLHLQSTDSPGIIEWAHRPFKSVEKHDVSLIRGINERCKPDDLLIHVGDFMNYGKNRGNESGRNKPDFYLSQIHCQVVCLEGNHDPNNKVRTIGRTLTTKVGRYVVSVGHYPSWDPHCEYAQTPEYAYMGATVPCRVRIHLCGHVHDAWRWKLARGGARLNVNIGVDAWRYRPVSEAELDAYISKVLAGKA